MGDSAVCTVPHCSILLLSSRPQVKSAYMFAMSASPNALHLTSVAPSISRAKS